MSTFELSKEDFDILFHILVYCEHNSPHRKDAHRIWEQLLIQAKQRNLFKAVRT